MSLSPINPLRMFLEKLASRSCLAELERQAILGLPGQRVQVQSNRDLVRLGQRADHACLVVEGLVGRFGQTHEGSRQIMAAHIQGDMANLHAVVVPNSGFALQALSAATIVHVPHAALRDVARSHPAIAEAFWRECVLDAALLAEWIVNVGRRDARARTAHLLCEFASRYGSKVGPVDFSFALPLTQNHLADMLALTPVHVNRTLKALREEGLANVHGRHVHIMDWWGMVKAGEFDPSYLQLGRFANDNPVAPAVGMIAG